MREWAPCKPHGNPMGTGHQDWGLPNLSTHRLVIPFWGRSSHLGWIIPFGINHPFRGRSSFLRSIIPFGVGYPFRVGHLLLGLVIPFGIDHPFWGWSSLSGSVIPFGGRSSFWLFRVSRPFWD